MLPLFLGLKIEDRGKWFLWNIGIRTSHDIASCFRRPSWIYTAIVFSFIVLGYLLETYTFVFVVSVLNDWFMWIISCVGHERNQAWPKLRYCPAFTWRNWKKSQAIVVEVLVKIQTRHPSEYKSKALQLGPTCFVDKHISLVQKC
jgi:hypothetical protein